MEMLDTTTYPKPHAIIVAHRLQGHVIPTVHLAINLASKGFTITFVNTEVTHHKIITSKQHKIPSDDHQSDNIFAGVQNSGLDIRYRTVSDGFPIEFDRFTNYEEFKEGQLNIFPNYVDELVGDIVRDDPSVSCLIVDTFYTWISQIAKKYKLVSVSFWTQPALVLILCYHMDLLKRNGVSTSQDTIDYIPGVKAIEPKDLISFLQETDTSTVLHRFLYKAFDDVKNVDFILCNTVHELELETILALQGKKPTYAIGPIFPSGFTKSIVPTSLRTEFDCTEWLDSKPHGSVLYISFGSCALCSKNDIEEIAMGLLLCEVNFIWAMRPNIVRYDEDYILPAQFLDQIKGRGLVVTWTNQIEVISHPSVGGFLTHCGWNSILESIRCGVPLLCFPLLMDQPTNRKLVVDDWRIGLNLRDGKSLTREEVAEKIGRLMSGKSAEELRKEMIKMRQTLENALAINGSSEKNLCQFITDVKTKISEKI
ncbi:hypothetical protein TIFTF001_008412 [Ficus carica]|uniref:Glycosyltransferase n=1 Tax=Ficus carica TaxID=3494 RepID=A0AA87ZSH7_FICCA|nr:hypothetical protein TIFTF001_008412 [Ficus carica]